MLQVVGDFHGVTLQIDLLSEELLRLRQESPVQIVAFLLLSPHDLRIFNVVTYFFLASPMARVRDATETRVVGVKDLFVLAFWSDPVWCRSSSAHECLRSRCERRGARMSISAQGPRSSIVLDTILNGQQVMKLEELTREFILGRFEHIHGCTSNIELRLLVVHRVSEVVSTDLSQALLLVVVAVFIELLIPVVEVPRFLC